MNVIGTVLTFIVGIEHIGICFLEIFGKPEMQAKAFDMDLDFVKQPAARISMANQGIYNGMLGLLLILVYFVFKAFNCFHCLAIIAYFDRRSRNFWWFYRN